MKRGLNIDNYPVYGLNSHQRRQKLSSLHFWICRQIGIVGTCKRVCLRPDESLVEHLRDDGVEVQILSYPQNMG